MKKFYRMKNRFDFLINNKEEIIKTYGYITKIKENIIKIFFPEINLEENYIIFNKKTEKISDIEYDLKNNIINSVKFMFDNKIYKYKLYEKVKCEIFILIKEDNICDKIKISILET